MEQGRHEEIISHAHRHAYGQLNAGGNAQQRGHVHERAHGEGEEDDRGQLPRLGWQSDARELPGVVDDYGDIRERVQDQTRAHHLHPERDGGEKDREGGYLLDDLRV